MPGNFYRGVGFSRLGEQSWTSTAGLTTTIEHIGTYSQLSALSNQAQNCGYRRASLTRAKEGGKIWKLRLSYVGRDPETITGGRAQIEELTSHWLTGNKLETLELWRHPRYAPLLDCEMQIATRVLSSSRDSGDPPGQLTYKEVNEQITNGKRFNTRVERSRFSQVFPYSTLIQRCTDAYRSALGRQWDSNFNNILVNIPVTTGDLQLNWAAYGFVKIDKPFSVLRNMISAQPDSSDWFSIIPVRSYIDPRFSGPALLRLADSFAYNLLARRDRQQWNRPVISNDRVVSESRRTVTSFLGIDYVWTSAQIRTVIENQRAERYAQTAGTPLCDNRDAVWTEIADALSDPNRFGRYYWVKRSPTIRQIGRGKLQVHQEWEAKLFPEINLDVTPFYTGVL